jgi:hypothetical protein
MITAGVSQRDVGLSTQLKLLNTGEMPGCAAILLMQENSLELENEALPGAYGGGSGEWICVNTSSISLPVSAE